MVYQDGTPVAKIMDVPPQPMKLDKGKLPAQAGLFNYFGRALQAVAAISGYGFGKYKSWGGWRLVEDGIRRYQDAKARHVLEGSENQYDAESGYLHAAHEAWNALAVLQLMLEQGQSLHVKDAQVASRQDNR